MTAETRKYFKRWIKRGLKHLTWLSEYFSRMRHVIILHHGDMLLIHDLEALDERVRQLILAIQKFHKSLDE